MLRRRFLRSGLLAAGGLLAAACSNSGDQPRWRMPDEGEPQTIAQFEPVSMLVREEELDLARGLVGPSVEFVAAPLDDLWMRDQQEPAIP